MFNTGNVLIKMQCKKSLKIPKGGNQNPYIRIVQIDCCLQMSCKKKAGKRTKVYVYENLMFYVILYILFTKSIRL